MGIFLLSTTWAHEYAYMAIFVKKITGIARRDVLKERR